MRLTDFMSGNVKNKKVADETESRRTVENPESIVSSDPDGDQSTSTGADTKPSASSMSETSKKKDRSFQKNWLIKFPWLQESDGSMKCKTCLDSKLKLSNPFVTETGCSNMRTSTLTRHEKSADHKRAVVALLLKNDMANAIDRSFNEKDEAILKLMEIVYFIAKKEIAISKLSQIKLAVRLGVDLSVLGSGYRSMKTADGLLAAISDNVSTDVYKEISDSEFLSISCDETTDISNTGELIVYTMVVDADLRVKTYFVGDYDIVDKTADGLTSKLKECFEEAGIDLTKVMALGSDGAATMTGCRNGVGVQLQRLNPLMIQFHCAARKLALCTSQAAESVSLMQKYKDTLKSIYYYFKGSHCRSDKLKAVQDILDSPRLKVKEIHDVRWFAFYDSLRVVYQCWEALAQTFNAAKDPKAKGLYEAITSYSFLALTYF